MGYFTLKLRYSGNQVGRAGNTAEATCPSHRSNRTTGMLDTGDGNLVYWEQCGNRTGCPL
jgi:hypothetical protein